MIRGSAALLMVLALASCRTYDYSPRISDSGGLVPGDQAARYGREQAQAIAIARRFAEVGPGGTDSAVAFARAQPDVVNAVPDSQSHRITVDFTSGWRLGVVPLDDGTAPGATPGLPAAGGR
jgi:hypothetical protein